MYNGGTKTKEPGEERREEAKGVRIIGDDWHNTEKEKERRKELRILELLKLVLKLSLLFSRSWTIED